MYVGQHKHLGFYLHLKGHKILFKRKKLHLKEFLNYSQRVLSEYSQFSAQKKLDTYLTHLGAAIAKLYYIINSVDSSKYPEAEALTEATLSFLLEMWITKSLINNYSFNIGKAIVKVRKNGNETNKQLAEKVQKILNAN